MKHLPSVLLALILAGAVAACLASHNLYGQTLVSRQEPVNIWRDAALRGLTYNEALALYRLRQSSTLPMPLHPRLRVGSAAMDYRTMSPTQYGATFSPAYPSAVQRPTQKPFANVQHPPTAFERYWPLMLEGREDPKTGQVFWYFP